MKTALIAIGFGALGLALAATEAMAFVPEPIPGSLIFPQPPHTKLTKAPVGSAVVHEFRRDGRKYRETYVIQRDRSLKLTNRGVGND